jgi:hypothetical protein
MSETISRAIHQAMAKHTLIQDHLGNPPRLYDSAPEDPIFPYLSYGRLRREDIGGDELSLFSHQMTLHLWSRYAGRAEVLTLMEAVKAVLNDSDLIAAELMDETLVSATILYSDVLRAPDGRTHHGLIRLSILTEI